MMNRAIMNKVGGQLYRNVMIGLMGLRFLIMRKLYKVLGSIMMIAA